MIHIATLEAGKTEIVSVDQFTDSLSEDHSVSEYLSRERLCRELQWKNVAVSREEWGCEGASHPLPVFLVVPSRISWPEIRFVCSQDLGDLERLEFAGWDSDRLSIPEALEMAEDLIKRRRCLVKEVKAGGRVGGMEPLEVDEWPDSLSVDTVSLEKVFFDAPAVDVEVDFSEYVRMEHLWVRRDYWLLDQELSEREK